MLDELPELTVLGAMDARLAELDAPGVGQPPGDGRHRPRRRASPPGLAVASMGAAVWLAARFGVPAVVDADLARCCWPSSC